MRRAGRFVADLEWVINQELPDKRPTLSWETTLQRDRGQFRRLKSRYWAVFALITAFALVSVGIGITLQVANDRAWELLWWIQPSAILIIGIFCWYGYAVRKDHQDQTEWLAKQDEREKQEDSSCNGTSVGPSSRRPASRPN